LAVQTWSLLAEKDRGAEEQPHEQSYARDCRCKDQQGSGTRQKVQSTLAPTAVQVSHTQDL
jgi:hypothetical protein